MKLSGDFYLLELSENKGFVTFLQVDTPMPLS